MIISHKKTTSKRCKKTGRFLKINSFDYVGGDLKARGVYQICCLANNKIYIGSTVTDCFLNRWRKHLYELQKNKHCNRHLQFAWNKHGDSNFVFTIMEYIEDVTIIIKKEQEYIDKNIDFGFDFNHCRIANGGNDNYSFNKKECIEILNRYVNEDVVKKDLANEYGVSEVTIKKIINKRYVHSRGIDNDLMKRAKEKAIANARKKSKESNDSFKSFTDIQAGQIRWLTNHTNIFKSWIAEYFDSNTGTIRGITVGRTYKGVIEIPCPHLYDEIKKEIGGKRKLIKDMNKEYHFGKKNNKRSKSKIFV